jgi:hypothetical protein
MDQGKTQKRREMEAEIKLALMKRYVELFKETCETIYQDEHIRVIEVSDVQAQHFIDMIASCVNMQLLSNEEKESA